MLSTLLYGQWDSGTYPGVAALALVMILIAVAGIALIAILDTDHTPFWRARVPTEEGQ